MDILDSITSDLHEAQRRLANIPKDNNREYKKTWRLVHSLLKEQAYVYQYGRVNYTDYIKSEAWRVRADDAKTRAGNRCQVCNKSAQETTLDAHHRTYERLGNEQPEDITVLCRDCHSLYHNGGVNASI